ncbi:MAG: hypothetical protein Q8L87_12915 [Anaerolineales bacterium]|jgi:hypothetical protein|nr:hypothetical protein [Anaerolineales bacterium]
MTLPSLLFGLVIALMLGALFHAVRGGSGARLLFYMGVSALGFALGQWLGMQFGWVVYKFGALDVGLGLVGGILVLVIADWLSRMEARDKTGV